MLLLIFAHGNMGRLVEQNVGSLQHGIDEQANAGTLAVLACLVLELRHAIEPTHARGAIQKPGKFSMGGHTGLIKKDGTIRIDPGGNKCGGHFPDVADALLTRFMHGDAVQRSEEHTSELQSLMRISYAV